jgi:hypothetical protein
MRTRVTSRRIAVAFLLAIISGVYFVLTWDPDRNNPAKRPSEEIRAELIEATPIGSNIDSVRQYIAGRWGGSAGRHQAYSYRTTPGFEWSTNEDREVIRVEYGRYSGSLWEAVTLKDPFAHVVLADYAFEDKKTLSKIVVWVFTDGS